MPLDDRQAAELTGCGDTQLHYHLADRKTNAVLQSEEKIKQVSTSYTVTSSDDYILVTAVSPVTITMPAAKGGKIYTIVRVSGASNVTVSGAGTDTINGAASLTISSSYSPHRLKTLNGTGYIDV